MNAPLVQAFSVNAVEELTGISRSGTRTEFGQLRLRRAARGGKENGGLGKGRPSPLRRRDAERLGRQGCFQFFTLFGKRGQGNF
jgi:hypothetical protein